MNYPKRILIQKEATFQSGKVVLCTPGRLMLPAPGGNQKASKQQLHAHVKEQSQSKLSKSNYLGLYYLWAVRVLNLQQNKKYTQEYFAVKHIKK